MEGKKVDIFDFKCMFYLLNPYTSRELSLVLRTFSTSSGSELYNNLMSLQICFETE